MNVPDIPDEIIAGRKVRIFAGVDPVAELQQDGTWLIKTGSCIQCGKCCMDRPPNHRFGVNPETGWCSHLEQKGREFRCNMGVSRPHSCAIARSMYPNCTVRWIEVK